MFRNNTVSAIIAVDHYSTISFNFCCIGAIVSKKANY